MHDAADIDDCWKFTINTDDTRTAWRQKVSSLAFILVDKKTQSINPMIVDDTAHDGASHAKTSESACPPKATDAAMQALATVLRLHTPTTVSTPPPEDTRARIVDDASRAATGSHCAWRHRG